MDDLQGRLEEWVGAGLITAEQAEAVADHEAGRRPSDREDETHGRDTGRWPLAAEAVGYLGAALVLVAAGVALGDTWDSLDRSARAVVTGLATAALVGLGLALRGSTEPATRRLASTALFLSVAGFGATPSVGLDVFETDAEPTAVAVAAVTTVYAGVLHVLLPRALQVLALMGATLFLAAALVGLAEVDDPLTGLVFWALGGAWVVAGGLAAARIERSRLLPRPRAALAAGAVLALVAAQVVAFDDEGLGLALGIVTAAALLAGGVAVGEPALLGIATAGLFVLVPQATFHFLGDSVGAAGALFASGVVLLAAAYLAVRLREQASRD